MKTMHRQSSPLDQAAIAAGWRPAANGRWTSSALGRSPSGAADAILAVAADHRNWLMISRPTRDCAPEEMLSRHADWLGPVKLRTTPNGAEQCLEVPLSFPAATLDDSIDPVEREGQIQLLTTILRQATTWLGNDDVHPGDTAPSADRLVEWLAEVQQTACVDERQDLRLTLKRPRFDGQVRVHRADGRLRFVMPLGNWPRLEPTARQAMLALAAEANARGRLMRIAWIGDHGSRRCEAQVDWTGLPYRDDGATDLLWRVAIGKTVSAMDLALRWLGCELEMLADPRNESLAQTFAECL